MTRTEIAEICRDVIYECFPDMEGTPLYDDTVINTDTAIDSMGFTLIICRLEARLDVKIPQRQWARMSTFGDVVTAFDRKINKKFIL
ncbi:MAG: acyl carrier protein [Lachnospiraceae bacterium]|nr:acyl carrier protein [Lachnospiraceae bacterium]